MSENKNVPEGPCLHFEKYARSVKGVPANLKTQILAERGTWVRFHGTSPPAHAALCV